MITSQTSDYAHESLHRHYFLQLSSSNNQYEWLKESSMLLGILSSAVQVNYDQSKVARMVYWLSCMHSVSS